MPAYKKNLLLQIGPIQTAVDLHTVKPSQSQSSVRRLCPEHKVPLSQQYVCTEDDNHKTFAWGEWASGVQTPDGWRIVRESERPSVAASDVLTLIPVPASEVRDQTFEGENIYYCQPSSEPSKLTWTILNRQMQSGKVVFLARGALRQGRAKLWKLELFRGYPVLREILFPENLKPTPETEPMKIDKETQTLVAKFIEASMSSWDDVDTTDDFKAKFDQWVAAGDAVQVKDAPTSGTTQSVEEMMAGLKESVRRATANKK